MKHKRASRRGWPRVVSGEEQIIHLPQGVIVDYQAGEVVRPLRVKFRDRHLLILDTGYRWVHFAPHRAHHTLTVQLSDAGVPQQLYVDICDGQGLDPDGVPYTEDLYLDVIATCEVQADGHWQVTETEIIDVEELEEALSTGGVSAEQYALAWAEARKVEQQLREQTFAPVEVIRRYLSDPYT